MINLFIDIETVPQTLELNEHPFKELFERKFSKKISELTDMPFPEDIFTQTVWEENAALHAEFGKVVCVVVASHVNNLRVKTFIGRDERELLTSLSEVLTMNCALIAHNGKEFDYPFLIRRFIINGIKVPPVLQTFNKKPWELSLHDTMELWSATQFKYRCSLDLLAQCLGLPSPKDEIDGSMVSDLYYSHAPQELEKIGDYCRKDVITLVNVWQRLHGLPLVDESKIEYA